MNEFSYRKFFAIFFIVVVTIFFHIFGILTPIENFFRLLINPISEKTYQLSVRIQENTEEFSSVENLQEAYKKLKEEYIKQTVDQARLRELEQENQELRIQLHFLTASPYHFLGADVIGKNTEPVGSVLILNRGEADGIHIGDTVIAGEGIFIGRIVTVQPKTSVVKLINDNESKVAASIQNRDRSVGVVEGRHGVSLHLVFVPQNETITVGETIVTSGLEENTPRGLLLGTIQSVEREPYQPFQQAEIEPAIDLDKITVVSILTL